MRIRALYHNAVQVILVVMGLIVILSCYDHRQSPSLSKRVASLAPIDAKRSEMHNHKIKTDKLVVLATINGNDNIAEKAQKALHAANIPALIGGSRSYGICVFERDRDRASSILEMDAKKHHYWILLDR
jgi:hypothetical protein